MSRIYIYIYPTLPISMENPKIKWEAKLETSIEQAVFLRRLRT
jgi:hypothetical protein